MYKCNMQAVRNLVGVQMPTFSILIKNKVCSSYAHIVYYNVNS